MHSEVKKMSNGFYEFGKNIGKDVGKLLSFKDEEEEENDGKNDVPNCPSCGSDDTNRILRTTNIYDKGDCACNGCGKVFPDEEVE